MDIQAHIKGLNLKNLNGCLNIYQIRYCIKIFLELDCSVRLLQKSQRMVAFVTLLGGLGSEELDMSHKVICI